MARDFSRAFYKSKEWQDVRNYVLMRDLYLCQNCGMPAEEVHHKIHLTPENIDNKDINLNPNNLISLCKACHFAEHRQDKANGIKEKAKPAFDDDAYEFDENGFLIEKKYPPHSK